MLFSAACDVQTDCRSFSLVPHFINTITFADGACEARSRQEEEDDAWPSSTTINGVDSTKLERSSTTPICPPGGDGTGRWLCRSSSTIPSIASSSLRALDTVALATNVTVFMKCGT